MEDSVTKKQIPEHIMKKIKELEKDTKKSEKRIQLGLTKFLIDKGYNNPKDVTILWKINIDDAKKLINEAKTVKFDDRAEPDIEKIKIEKGVSWIEAVAEYYEHLMTPRCGYGAGILKKK